MTEGLVIGKQMSEVAVQQMSDAVKSVRLDLPPELFDVLREEVNGVIEENLPARAGLVIPLYHKHFTYADIKALIGFYNTDAGRKAIRLMPELLREGMATGQQWGQSLGPEIERRVIQRFKPEGVDLSA